MSMNTLVLLLTIATSTLVLRSGDRITVEGPVREENGVITFRMNGLLYSIPASEVERRVTAEETAKQEDETKPLKVSAEERERLLEALERNHSGQPAPPEQLALQPPPPPPTPAEELEKTLEEWEWRRIARHHEESIRQAQEEVQLLEDQIEKLRREIVTLTNLGYKPRHFTYQTTRLAYAIDALPAAKLEVTRAERAYAQFREDARRLGVLPGWLR